MIGLKKKMFVWPTRLKGNLKHTSNNIFHSVGDPELGSQCCFKDITILGLSKKP